MKKKTRIALITVVIVGVVGITAMALPFGRDEKPEFVNYAPITQIGQVFFQLRDLDLTQEQKVEMAGIIQTYRAEIRESAEALIDARIELGERIHNPAKTDDDVRAVCASMADAQLALSLTRKEMSAELREVLTPEQREVVREVRQNVVDFVLERIDHVISLFNRWITYYNAG